MYGYSTFDLSSFLGLDLLPKSFDSLCRPYGRSKAAFCRARSRYPSTPSLTGGCGVRCEPVVYVLSSTVICSSALLGDWR